MGRRRARIAMRIGSAELRSEADGEAVARSFSLAVSADGEGAAALAVEILSVILGPVAPPPPPTLLDRRAQAERRCVVGVVTIGVEIPTVGVSGVATFDGERITECDASIARIRDEIWALIEDDLLRGDTSGRIDDDEDEIAIAWKIRA